MWFRRHTPPHHVLLLRRRPLLPLEFEPPTPCITKVRTRTHGTVEPLPCLLDLTLCPEQPRDGTDHEWVIRAFLERVHTTRLALWPRLCPDSHRPEQARRWAFLQRTRK